MGNEALALAHLITLILNESENCRSLSDAETEFDSGKAMAYHEVISFVEETLRTFNLTTDGLKLSRACDADKLL